MSAAVLDGRWTAAAWVGTTPGSAPFRIASPIGAICARFEGRGCSVLSIVRTAEPARPMNTAAGPITGAGRSWYTRPPYGFHLTAGHEHEGVSPQCTRRHRSAAAGGNDPRTPLGIGASDVPLSRQPCSGHEVLLWRDRCPVEFIENFHEAWAAAVVIANVSEAVSPFAITSEPLHDRTHLAQI